MTPTDLAAALKRLGLEKEQACRLLGVSPRAWRSWHEERRGPHPSTVRLLWLMELDPNNIEALQVYADNEEASQSPVHGA